MRKGKEENKIDIKERMKKKKKKPET